MGLCQSRDEPLPVAEPAGFLAHSGALRFEDFEVHGEVERASTSVTVAAVRRKNGNKCNLKMFRSVDAKNAAGILHERQMLELFYRCPYVLFLKHAFHTPRTLYIVTAPTAGCTLRSYVEQHGLMKDELAKFFAAELVTALEYVHSKMVVHRNVCPENCQLDVKGHLCLSGLRNCCMLSKEDGYRARGKVGTRGFTAPEVLIGDAYGIAADLWSAGATLFFLTHGKPPTSMDGREDPTPDNYRVQFTQATSPVLRDLLTKMLAFDPAVRPSIADIRGHDWFQGVNWRNVRAKKLDSPWLPPIRPPAFYALDGDDDAAPVISADIVAEWDYRNTAAARQSVVDARRKSRGHKDAMVLPGGIH